MVGHGRALVRRRPGSAGQHLGDVLLTRPGQGELLGQALAEVGAGRAWTATVDLAFAGAEARPPCTANPRPAAPRPGPAVLS